MHVSGLEKVRIPLLHERSLIFASRSPARFFPSRPPPDALSHGWSPISICRMVLHRHLGVYPWSILPIPNPIDSNTSSAGNFCSYIFSALPIVRCALYIFPFSSIRCYSWTSITGPRPHRLPPLILGSACIPTFSCAISFRTMFPVVASLPRLRTCPPAFLCSSLSGLLCCSCSPGSTGAYNSLDSTALLLRAQPSIDCQQISPPGLRPLNSRRGPEVSRRQCRMD